MASWVAWASNIELGLMWYLASLLSPVFAAVQAVQMVATKHNIWKSLAGLLEHSNCSMSVTSLGSCPGKIPCVPGTFLWPALLLRYYIIKNNNKETLFHLALLQWYSNSLEAQKHQSHWNTKWNFWNSKPKISVFKLTAFNVLVTAV